MAHYVRVEGTVQDLHLFEEVACLLMHSRRCQLGCNLLKLVLRDSNIVVGHAVSSLCWQASLQVQIYGRMVVSFTLFDFRSLRFLVGLEEPLEIVVLELPHVCVLELLSNLDTFVPSVQLLVHRHGFFDLVVLDQNRFSLVELLVQDSKLCLDSKVVCTFCCNQLVQLAKVVSLGHVAEGGIASLSHVEILLF